MPADGIRCEKIHSLCCQRCKVFANSRVYPTALQAALQQWFGSPLTMSEGVVTMFVGKPSHLRAFVGPIEGQCVMYYLKIVLKWEEWIHIPQRTAGGSADVSICSSPSLRCEPCHAQEQCFHRGSHHCSDIRCLIITPWQVILYSASPTLSHYTSFCRLQVVGYLLKSVTSEKWFS